MGATGSRHVSSGKGRDGRDGCCRIRTTVPVDGVLRKMGVGEQVGLHSRVCRNKRNSEDGGSNACSSSSARPVAKEG